MRCRQKSCYELGIDTLVLLKRLVGICVCRFGMCDAGEYIEDLEGWMDGCFKAGKWQVGDRIRCSAVIIIPIKHKLQTEFVWYYCN